MKATLKLMVKPPVKKVPRVPLGQWEFKWATDNEVPELKKQGYVRLKEI